mmetsp:Transcript_42572/g.97629  ORF Transcript_42572/g.97629 Transcript_42572/m.97629 type:complete len:215 (-) Transcript_42572:476-1120(-)
MTLSTPPAMDSRQLCFPSLLMTFFTGTSAYISSTMPPMTVTGENKPSNVLLFIRALLMWTVPDRGLSNMLSVRMQTKSLNAFPTSFLVRSDTACAADFRTRPPPSQSFIAIRSARIAREAGLTIRAAPTGITGPAQTTIMPRMITVLSMMLKRCMKNAKPSTIILVTTSNAKPKITVRQTQSHSPLDSSSPVAHDEISLAVSHTSIMMSPVMHT